MHEYPSGLRRLAAAVIERALRDARGEVACASGSKERHTLRAEAIQWIASSELDHWCLLAGLSAHRIRKHYQTAQVA